MAFASPKMVTQFLYLDDNVIDVNFEILKCRSQEVILFGLQALRPVSLS